MPNLISQEQFRSLAESVEILKAPNDFFGKYAFARVETFATSTVDFDVYEQSRKVLPYVSRKVEGPNVDKQGFRTNTVTPPYLKPKFSVTPRDLETRLAGKQLYVDGGANLSAEFQEYLARRIYDELEVLVRRTIAAQQAQAATLGKVTALNEAGKVEYEVNYQRDATLLPDGGAQDTANIAAFTADPSALFLNAADAINKLAGMRANIHVVLGADVRDAFRAHAKVQGAISRDWSDRGRLGFTPDNSGANWLGVIDGINYWHVPDWYVNPTTGVLTPVVANKHALVFAEGAGAMYYGGLELFDNRVGARALDTYEQDKDPKGQVIQLHCSPLAVTTVRNGFNYLKVVA